MDYTIEEHYRESEEMLPIEDERHFDSDLRTIFGTTADASAGEEAAMFLRRHRRELVRRIAYWTGESTMVTRQLVDLWAERAQAMALRVVGLEASTLIELTAFGTAVMMNYRYTHALGGARAEER